MRSNRRRLNDIPSSAPASILVAVTMILASAGCTDGEATPDNPSVAASSPTAGNGTDDPTDRPPTTSKTAAGVDAITGGKSVELSLKTLPPPPTGFNRAQLHASAERAMDIVTRGISSDLYDKSPAEAFRYVFANQYPQTTANAATTTETAVSNRYDWHWAWASMFKNNPADPPSILSARWQVDTEAGALSDGTPADMLEVILAVVIEHLVPTGTGDSVEPVIVQRSIVVRGYDPLGGPEWWPSITVQAGALLDDGCALVNGSRLAPTDDPKRIRRGLRQLRTLIENPTQIEPGAQSEGSDFDSFVKRHCS